MWLALGGADPPGDQRGAGQAGLGQCGPDAFQFRWVQPVGETGQVAKAVRGLDDGQRVAIHPYFGVGGEGTVAAQQVQLLGVAEIEADQAAGTGPLIPGRPPVGVGRQLPEPRCRC